VGFDTTNTVLKRCWTMKFHTLSLASNWLRFLRMQQNARPYCFSRFASRSRANRRTPPVRLVLNYRNLAKFDPTRPLDDYLQIQTDL
jgi:hypothetical protein